MRRYELMLLLRPDLEDDRLQAAVEKVTRAIVNGGGSLSKVSPWGKRRLAYDINRHREASYFLIHFDIEPAQVREIERGMLISEEILRHLVTVLEERGPADELAPAAAARLGGDEETDGDASLTPSTDAGTAAAGTATAGSADAVAIADEPRDGPSADADAGEDDGDTSDDTSEGTSDDTSEGTSEGTSEDEPDAGPTDQERVEG